MNPLQTIAGGYKRLRHSYGFGVHSPSAFRMVCDVLIDRRGYTYYDFDRLETATQPASQRRRTRILHRLAARYPCRDVIIDDSIPEAWRLALAPAQLDTAEGTLLVARSLPDALPTQGVTALFNLSPQDLAELERMMQYGILLAGKDAAIAILNPKTRFVKYTVRI